MNMLLEKKIFLFKIPHILNIKKKLYLCFIIIIIIIPTLFLFDNEQMFYYQTLKYNNIAVKKLIFFKLFYILNLSKLFL